MNRLTSEHFRDGEDEWDDGEHGWEEYEAVPGIGPCSASLSEEVQRFAWEIAASICKAPDMSLEVKRMLSLQAEPLMEWHPGQLSTLQMTVCVQEFQRKAREIYMAEAERQRNEGRNG